MRKNSEPELPSKPEPLISQRDQRIVIEGRDARGLRSTLIVIADSGGWVLHPFMEGHPGDTVRLSDEAARYLAQCLLATA